MAESPASSHKEKTEVTCHYLQMHRKILLITSGHWRSRIMNRYRDVAIQWISRFQHSSARQTRLGPSQGLDAMAHSACCWKKLEAGLVRLCFLGSGNGGSNLLVDSWESSEVRPVIYACFWFRIFETCHWMNCEIWRRSGSQGKARLVANLILCSGLLGSTSMGKSWNGFCCLIARVDGSCRSSAVRFFYQHRHPMSACLY